MEPLLAYSLDSFERDLALARALVDLVDQATDDLAVGVVVGRNVGGFDVAEDGVQGLVVHLPDRLAREPICAGGYGRADLAQRLKFLVALPKQAHDRIYLQLLQRLGGLRRRQIPEQGVDMRRLPRSPLVLQPLVSIDNGFQQEPRLATRHYRRARSLPNLLKQPRQTFVSLRILVAKGLRLFRRPCLADDILLRLNIREPLEEIGLLQTYFSRLHLGDHAIKSLLIVEMEIQREATVSRFIDRFNRSHYFVFRLLLLNTILLSSCKYMAAPLNLWPLP